MMHLNTDRTNAEDGKRIVDGDAGLAVQDDKEKSSKHDPSNSNEDGPVSRCLSAPRGRCETCHVLWTDTWSEQGRPVGMGQVVSISDTFITLTSLGGFGLS